MAETDLAAHVPGKRLHTRQSTLSHPVGKGAGWSKDEGLRIGWRWSEEKPAKHRTVHPRWTRNGKTISKTRAACWPSKTICLPLRSVCAACDRSDVCPSFDRWIYLSMFFSCNGLFAFRELVCPNTMGIHYFCRLFIRGLPIRPIRISIQLSGSGCVVCFSSPFLVIHVDDWLMERNSIDL